MNAAEESAAASEQLAAQAYSLQGLLARFTLPADEETGSRQVYIEQKYRADAFSDHYIGPNGQDMLTHMTPDKIINLEDRLADKP